MRHTFRLAATVSVMGVAYATLAGAAPPAPPPPIANYWMSAATDSGFGSAGGMGAIAAMMGRGGGNASNRTLTLQLGSRMADTNVAVGDHLPPTGLGMGTSLPLRGRVQTRAEPTGMPGGIERPQGRMLIYWGCGEHVGPGQPMVIDFAKLAAGQMPPGWAAMTAGMSVASPQPGRGRSYGDWPNDRDPRNLPGSASLVGLHNVRSVISPPIAFTLAAGQDFMPALGLAERGSLPSGAARLGWQQAPSATGYALSMMGVGGAEGDMIMWSSSRTGGIKAMGLMDYLPPAKVRQLIAAGQVLAPSISECLLPAEVARAVPAGFVRMIGFGPEIDFAEAPRAPKWVAKVRFKTSANLIRGMDLGGASAATPDGRAAPRKKKPGWRDLLKGVSPLPLP